MTSRSNHWHKGARRTLLTVVVIGSVLLLVGSCWAAESYQVVVERNVGVKMRDGVVLQADIYRPKAPGKFPVLLQRTPYDRYSSSDFPQDFDLQAAGRGYVVIVQDSRGRFGSEGDWYPFKYDGQDGYDTVEWAASLPYSSGKVGMFGGSGEGIAQIRAAMVAPPHLAGLFPFVTAADYHNGWAYQGGAFELWFSQTWLSRLLLDTLDRNVLKAISPLDWYQNLPVSSYPQIPTAAVKNPAPYYKDWLAHPNDDNYWKQVSIEEHYPQVTVPAFHYTKWYDVFLGGTLRNYEGIKNHGATEAARRGQRLYVMVGSHLSEGRKIGVVDFGPEAVNFSPVTELVLRWYDYLLKGIPNGMEHEKPVKYFVMGRNQWAVADSWPPPEAAATRYYLHSKGAANSLSGDGGLSTQPPSAEPPEHFVYDPADPVPTNGGNLCCDPKHFPPGPFDQRPNESRDDVIVYSTPVLQEDVEVTGPVTADLYVSSSAADTDFTAKLVDVWPNGFADNLADGILRARYRNSAETAEFMNPGNIYRLSIDLLATSNVFKSGHRIRVEISSSNFPRFDRNLNTGENPGTSTRMVKATNMVYHDGDHPSAVILPVMPSRKSP